MALKDGEWLASLGPWGATVVKGLLLLFLGAGAGLLMAPYLNPVGFSRGSLRSHDVFIIAKKPAAAQAGDSAQQQQGGKAATETPAAARGTGLIRGPAGKVSVVNLTAVGPDQLDQPQGQQQLQQLQQLLLHVQDQLTDVQHNVEQQKQQKQHQQQQQQQQADTNGPSWPTDHQDPSGDTCRDGLLAAPRSIFWPWNDDLSPGLADVFQAEDRVYVMFNLKIPQPARDKWNELLAGNWSMEFYTDPLLGLPNTTVSVHDIGMDGHGHTFTLTAPLPLEYAASHPTHRSVRLNIKVQHKEGLKLYEAVPLCLTPTQQPGDFMHLVACTELTAAVADAVPEWAVYHHVQGVEQTYIYVDDELDKLRPQLEPLLKAGIVTVIDWHWPARYKGMHMFQQAEQNGCLMRMRGRARWVLLNDVDEFVQPMQPGVTVASFLEQHAGLDYVGALIVQGAHWGSSSNATRQAALTAAGGRLALAKYRSRGACCKEGRKMIANPRGMSYNSVHGITTGGQEHGLDGWKELRINHFKPYMQLPEADESLAAYVGAINSTLQQMGYPASP